MTANLPETPTRAERHQPPAAQGSLTASSAAGLAALVARGDLSALEVVEAHIARIEAVNPHLNAVVVPLFDDARREARAADARRGAAPRGPLYGVPVTVKECFDVRGTPSTAGLLNRAGHRAAEDAALVRKLRQAGAIVLGKTNVSQLLLYVESDNPVYGRTNNPWNLDRSAGGSSGGEAAMLAAGGAALGLGTDIGGSVRVPAHFCGVCGFKPTPGRLSLQGTVDELIAAGNEAIPNTAGPLARSVADLALAMRVLSAPDACDVDPLVVPVPPPDPPAVDLRTLRVGFYEDDGYFQASAALRRAVQEAAAALRQLGVRVEPFSPPAIGRLGDLGWKLLAPDAHAGLRRLLGGEAPDPRLAEILRLTGTPNRLRPLLARLFRARGQRRVADLLPNAGLQTTRQFLDLMVARWRYQSEFTAAMAAAGLDALLCPPNSLPAVPHGATKELGVASVNYTFLFNLLGYPAGVVPVTRVQPGEETGRPTSKDAVDETARRVDLGSAGLPVGVQVAARPWRDDVVLAVMGALEQAFRGRPGYPLVPDL